MTEYNVVVVILDTVRARNCSLYGHNRETTPTLEAIADEAVTYETAIAPSSWSLPSHASLLTGKYPSELNTHAHSMVLPNDITTFPETLSGVDYDTGLFTANPFLATGSGLDRGFRVTDLVTPGTGVPFPDAFDPQSYIRSRDAERGVKKWVTLVDQLTDSATNIHKNLVNALYYKLQTSRFSSDIGENLDCGEEVVEAFDDWILNVDGPICSMLNIMEAHLPYEQRDTFLTGTEPVEEVTMNRWAYMSGERPFGESVKEAFERLYDGAIRAADGYLAEIVDRLRAADMWSDTVLVVTSDHGEYLGEEGYLGHDINRLGPPLVEVPLVIRYPDGTAGRVSDPVSLTELPETLSASKSGEVGGLHPDADRADMVKCEVFGMNQVPDEQYAETAATFDSRATVVYTRGGERYEFREGITSPAAPAPVETFAAMEDTGDRHSPISHTEEIERRLEDLGYR